MTSDKSVLTEDRFNALFALATDWANLGTLSNSWAKTGGSAKYQRTLTGLVIIQMVNITVGTTTNGTNVFTSGNGPPSGFRPGDSLWFTVRCDVDGNQTSAFMFHPDGHIECWGIGATATRVDCNIMYLAEN